MDPVSRRGFLGAAALAAGCASPSELALEHGARPGRLKISRLTSTLVASPDAALLNSWDVHPSHFTRTIVEVETADGLRGVGESSARAHEGAEAARSAVLGRDPLEIERFRREIPSIHAFGAVETACLDLVGRAVGRPVVDLLGGPFRKEVRYSAYVFFVLPTPEAPGVTTPEEVAKEAADLCRRHGFRSIKFKGGVLAPEREVEALARMRELLPGAALRIDPNAAWSVETSLRVAKSAAPLRLEYLEDPTPGMDGMAEVRRKSGLPLATNMVVTRLEHVAEAARKEAVDVVLLDNHYMGGLTSCRQFATVCEALGWGCSGHSNNHLGISMAAMTHMNAAISRVGFDADTHYVWTTDDVIRGPKLAFKDGALAVPEGPGLGVELDRDKLEALAANVARVKDRRDLLRKWNPAHPEGKRGVRW
jgi:glucarate dehydratase